MIKTYLVPVTDVLVKEMEEGRVPSFLHCATCLDGLTNGEVIRKMFPNAKVTIDGTTVCLKFEYYHEIWFDLDWWNAKWEDCKWKR